MEGTLSPVLVQGVEEGNFILAGFPGPRGRDLTED